MCFKNMSLDVRTLSHRDFLMKLEACHEFLFKKILKPEMAEEGAGYVPSSGVYGGSEGISVDVCFRDKKGVYITFTLSRWAGRLTCDLFEQQTGKSVFFSEKFNSALEKVELTLSEYLIHEDSLRDVRKAA